MAVHPGTGVPLPLDIYKQSSRPGTPTPGTPSASKSDLPFEFSVPSIPPRLANFGRKISQMRDDFMLELDPPTQRSSREFGVGPGGSVGTQDGGGAGGLRREKTISGTPRVNRPEREEVPGMGDDPVMCPFCEKPLPPALFSQHIHKRSPTSQVRPRAHSRSMTADGLSTLDKTAAPAPPPIVTATKLLDPLPVKSPEQPSYTPSLVATVTDADAASIGANKAIISDKELRRWSKLAGLPPPPPPPKSKASGSGVAIPKLSPPPGGSGKPTATRSSSSSSSRFNFFARSASKSKADGGESSDEEGGQAGYAKITGDASDTDEDDETEEVLRDEPKEIEDKVDEHKDEKPEGKDSESGGTAESEIEAASAAPPLSTEDLQSVLKEVLGKLNEMSKSHSTLATSQASLLTSLKIARSNLAMAEANTEMLEAQLKTVSKGSSSPLIPSGAVVPRTPATAPSVSRAVPASATVNPIARRSEERARPTSLQMPLPGSSVPNDKSTAWGFWNGGKKKLGSLNLPSPSQVIASIPTPTGERGGFDFHAPAPANGAYRSSEAVKRVSSEASELTRSASMTTLSTSPQSTTKSTTTAPAYSATYVNELAKLRQNHLTATKQMEAMSKELAELKKGKVEMEAELENLSQALFEEANKMVSDERRKKAELEESLKEVKAEREALRETIKVLGGAKPADTGSVGIEEEQKGVNEVKAEENAEEGGGEEQIDSELFVPRDLDKHYEALRKSISHVADGAELPIPGSRRLAVPELVVERDELDPQVGSFGEYSLEESVSVPETIPETSTNSLYASPMAKSPAGPPIDDPWASAGSVSDQSESTKLPGEDRLLGKGANPDGRSQSPAAEELDRLMEKLQADME